MSTTTPSGRAAARDEPEDGTGLQDAARRARHPGTVRVYTHTAHLRLELSGVIGKQISEDLEVAFEALRRERRPLDIDAGRMTGMDDTGRSFLARCIWYCDADVTFLTAPAPLRRYLAETHLDQLATVSPEPDCGLYEAPRAGVTFVPTQRRAG